jgi:glycosyltransferase involved in cell wall biosynthesis
MYTKIIYTIDTLNYGGAERSTIDIVTRLGKEFEPVVVTFYKNNPLQPLLEEQGIKVINIDLEGKYDFIKGIKAFKAICKEETPHVVVATLFRSEIISRIVCKQLGIINIGTFVCDTYAPIVFETMPSSTVLKINLLKYVNRYTAKFCTRFISNAHSIKTSNAKVLNVKNKNVDVIYRGRDVSKFIVAPRTFSKPFRFVNVGRLRHQKNQALMINAFADLLKYHPDATLDIAGNGPLKESLTELIQSLGIENKVRLLGNVDDIPKLLGEYHAFVFASNFEGFSGALVEAMLAGIPIIASDIPMNLEAVEHMVTGYIFPVKNKRALTEAMLFSIDHYKEMLLMANKARETAEKTYDLDRIVKQHENVYRHCLKNNLNKLEYQTA